MDHRGEEEREHGLVTRCGGSYALKWLTPYVVD